MTFGAMRTFANVQELQGGTISESARPSGSTVDSGRQVNLFADATGDHQWIHIAWSGKGGPVGGTIAHGYLSLSLLPSF